MKKPHSTPGATESRWLMILPVAALALGCESKSPETSEEPAAQLAVEVKEQAAEDVDPKGAEPEEAQPAAVESAPAPSAEANEKEASATSAAAPSPAPDGKPTAEKKPADAPAAAAPMRRGAAAKGEGYTVWLEGKGTHKLNEPSSVSVVLLAEDPFKCNEQYPYRFTAATSPGIQYTDPVVRSMNVTKQRSTMTIPFTPSANGSQTISGELAFSVCTEDKCLIEKQKVSLAVDIGGS